MISRSIPASRSAITRTFRTLKFTCSTPAISHWTRLRTRSRDLYEALLVRQVKPGRATDPLWRRHETVSVSLPQDHDGLRLPFAVEHVADPDSIPRRTARQFRHQFSRTLHGLAIHCVYHIA